MVESGGGAETDALVASSISTFISKISGSKASTGSDGCTISESCIVEGIADVDVSYSQHSTVTDKYVLIATNSPLKLGVDPVLEIFNFTTRLFQKT